MRAQQNPSAELSSILAEINAGGLHNEMDAFNLLIAFRSTELPQHPDLLPQINLGFIKILSWVNADANRRAAQPRKPAPRPAPGAPLPPDTDGIEGTFLGNAIGAVVGLHDPRAIPALLDDIETGNMATEALAGFGNAAVAPLLSRLKAQTAGTTVCLVDISAPCVADLHASALRALTQMAPPPVFAKLCPSNQTLIRGLIIGAMGSMPLNVRHGGDRAMRQATGIQGAGLLGDRSLEPTLLRLARGALNPMIRMTAVVSLSDLRDPALRPALQKIAQSDPDPNVRAAALAALKKPGSGQ